MTVAVQVRGDRHGGSGPVADGLPLPEHQALRGELPAHGGQAAGVQRTRPAGPGNQLGKTPSVEPRRDHVLILKHPRTPRAASQNLCNQPVLPLLFDLMKDQTRLWFSDLV